MIHAQRIIPSTDFVRNFKTVADEIDIAKEPIGLTIHGKLKLVVMDAERFEELSAIEENRRFLVALDKGMQSIEEGRTMTLEEFKAKMRAEFEIQG